MSTIDLNAVRVRQRRELAFAALGAGLGLAIGFGVLLWSSRVAPPVSTRNGRLGLLVVGLSGLVCVGVGSSGIRRIRGRLWSPDMSEVSSIASAKPGRLSIVEGQVVVGDAEILQAPVTRRAAVYYKMTVDKWAPANNGATQWSNLHLEEDSVSFVLDDGSGELALLEPEYTDVHEGQRWKCEYVQVDPELSPLARTYESTRGIDGFTEPARSYLLASAAAVESLRNADKDRLRLVEVAVGPGTALTVTGTIERGRRAYRHAGASPAAIRQIVWARAASIKDLRALDEILARFMRLYWLLVLLGVVVVAVGLISSLM